jgi:hypothetical protein
MTRAPLRFAMSMARPIMATMEVTIRAGINASPRLLLRPFLLVESITQLMP